MAASLIRPELSPGQVGTLIATLSQRIVEVERHARVCGATYDDATRQNNETYLADLKDCLSAVKSATMKILSSSPPRPR